MTDPPAWPEVDEDVLRTCADAFETVSKTVGAQLDAAKQERLQMFGGVGIWSGGGADAASGCTRQADRGLGVREGAARRLRKAVQRRCHGSREREEPDHRQRRDCQQDPGLGPRSRADIPDDEKEAAIRAGVDAIRAENVEVVATAGSQNLGEAAAELPEAPRPRSRRNPSLPTETPSRTRQFLHASNV